MKNTQKARQYLKKTTKIIWNIDDADDIERCWLMLAATYAQATKYEEALDLCKKVLVVNKVRKKRKKQNTLQNKLSSTYALFYAVLFVCFN